MPIRPSDLLRNIAPHAKACYVDAFANGDALFQAHGITTPKRLAAFLGQAMVETGSFTIERESGNYRADRIVEIFGVGHHSAAVTQAEADRLAGNGPALFERVYGLGNPKKATELGNTQSGDGWTYRGNGILQTTGRGNHRRMGQKCGVDFEGHPELVTAAAHALKPALAEWSEGNLNALADDGSDDALTRITRKINGGTNGLSDRIAWTHKVLPLIDAIAFAPTSAPAAESNTMPPISAAKPVDAPAATPGIEMTLQARIARLQAALKAGGGDPGVPDGLLGMKTLRALQQAQKLPMTGTIDNATYAALSEALANI